MSVRSAEAAAPAAFALVEEEVLGQSMAVFADRYRSLPALLDASLAFGDREYLVDGDRRLTYAQHHAAVARFARTLAERGVGPGDRVALCGFNSLEWVVAFWATVSLGAIAVGLNAWWSPAERDYAVGHCQPAVLLDDLTEVTAALHGPAAALPAARIAEDDAAVILYTSGTTGRPKGATHSHRNLLTLVQAQRCVAARRLPPGVTPPPARTLLTTPLFHVSGLHSGVVAALGGGGTVIWPAGRFDPEATLATIERERVTSWTAVPTMVWRTVHHPRVAAYDTSSLRHIGGGGASWSPALQAAMRRVFGESLSYGVGYGLTECSGLATSASFAELLDHPETVGRPAPTVQVRTDGGEICIRGPMVMLGYWRDEAATAAVLDADRWLHTGDLGELRDGLLYLTTRRTDLILRGGENVYPQEVENCLEEHPGVAEAAVVGIPDDEMGARVAAVVVRLPGAAVDGDALAAHVATRLARFKVPQVWVLRDDPLPRNAAGKVLRAAVLPAAAEGS